MKILATLPLAFFLAGGLVSPAPACIPGIEWIDDFAWDPAGPVSVCVFPDQQARAFLAGGQEISVSLNFPVISYDGDPPFDAVPVECLAGGPEVTCRPYDVLLDSDPEGWLTWVPDFRGGGHRGPDVDVQLSLWIPICPNQQLDLTGDIYFNSPDINGDLKVDLADVPLFAQDFFSAYDYRSDFNWDGLINLLDIEIMAQSVGAVCE